MKNVIISCLLVIYDIVFKHIFIKDKHETRTLEKMDLRRFADCRVDICIVE